MNTSPNGPRFRPADLRDPSAAHDALLHWDELDEQFLRLLAKDPEHGGRLTTLQRADGWLRQRAADTIAPRSEAGGSTGPGPDLLACPPPDDLYEFGQGPGAGGLSPERRAEVDRHLATCLACERLVATLGTRPPSPLVLEGVRGGLQPGEAQDAARLAARILGQAGPADGAPRRGEVHRFPRFGLLVAAAAGLVLAVGVWRSLVVEARSSAWPTDPVLRGEAPEALCFPRDRLLERTPALARLSPAFAGPIQFEVRPQAASQGVRIELYRTAGGAFDEPQAVAAWEVEPAAGAVLSDLPEAAGASPLAPGHYTWKAWTREHGLDVELGSRDFEVVTDDALTRELAALLSQDGDDAGVRAVRVLHERGFRTDARALARTLPPSRERDAYLDRTPGR